MSSRRKSSRPCVLRSSLNDEEEEKCEDSFITPSYRDHEDFHHSEGQLYVRTICNFSTNNFDSLSCHNEVQLPDESRTVDCEKDGTRLESVCEFSSAGEDSGKAPNSSVLEKGLEAEKDEIRAVSVNGTIIIPEPMCHVTPLLQRPPDLSSSPTIAVPLHTSRYNPDLDHNATLIESFSRFPYPTVAELSWLTAASRHPEEQIKVWFTTQRLKQGITWSPEEVEEARKKMFNGSIPTPRQTCAVSPAPDGELALCLASNSTANILPLAYTPGTLRQTQPLKRSLGTPLLASEVKRPAVPPTGDPGESLRMPPPPERMAFASSPGFSETRTSSPASRQASGMKIPVAAYCVPPKGNLPMVQSKEKIPSVLSRERLPLSPIVSTNLKRSLIHQQISTHTSASSFVPKNKLSCFGKGVAVPSAPAGTTPQVNRPTIIQTLSSSPTLVRQSTEPLMFSCFSSQNNKEIPHGDVKHGLTDSQNDSQNSCVGLALREHSVPTQFPLLERVKDKSPGQMTLLEESFQRNSFPSYNEVEHLTIATRLSREELESWFLERRALRDYLEQALLSSMGSKQESQQPVLNGAQRRSGPHAFSPVPPNSKSVNLVKNVFVQSRRPSPVGFMQTRMARRELVRWFRDSRLSQQSRDRKEAFREWNSAKRPSPKERPEENIKPSSPEIENRFDNTGRSGGATGDGREDCGNTCEPLSESG